MAIFSAISTALAGLGGAGAAAGGAASAVGTGAAAGAAVSGATSLSGLTGAIGTIGGLAGQFMQMSGAKQAAEASAKAEGVRYAQSRLEGIRQKRQIIRQAIVARADALTAATAQGAADGSGIQGGLAQIGNEADSAGTAVNQNWDLSKQMFRQNARIAAGQSRQATGAGISSLAGALVKNQGAIGRVGTYYGV